ncbi:hypothetical protein [Longimicrobium sp.]|uniref:poly(ethylene terephthalate) hydrolase family protein n=1 Tax=Longimicrobium sp. TaxID=2029185 RepID=UPI002BD776DD|nr:hypothetical protein [Longimicrobium sp.]HSU17359.1 hypothetical protein [Longimicrobium sp.]
MLALDSRATLVSSVTVHGLLAPIAQLDIDAYIDQPVVYDGWTATKGYELKVFVSLEVLRDHYHARVNDLITQKFLSVDSSPPDRYRVHCRLRIVYPCSRTNPQKLKGSGKLPVVVLVHGHTEVLVASHTGFTYLQNYLASKGIVSVSVDTNAANAFDSYVLMRAHLVLGALDVLRELAAPKKDHPFSDRLDFDNVGMLGHSRGGDAVVLAAIMNPDRPDDKKCKITAVCALAPTDLTGPKQATGGDSRLTNDHASFFAVIYGALDGDVVGGRSDGTGTGFRLYDRASAQKSMVFLDRCCHNPFNTIWEKNDRSLLQSDIDNGRVLDWLSHHEVGKAYIGGLFRWRLLKQAKARSLFDGSAKKPVGGPASIQWSFGEKIYPLDEMYSNPVAGIRTVPGITMDMVSVVGVDGTPVKNRTNHQTRVLVLPPTLPATAGMSAYKLENFPVKDWSAYDLFTFRACADADVSTQQTVNNSLLPEFTLVFSDGDNNSVSVLPASWTPQPRRPVFHQIKPNPDGENRTVIRLETLSIKLSDVAKGGVNLTQMASIEVVAPANFAFHQFLDSFQLVKR